MSEKSTFQKLADCGFLKKNFKFWKDVKLMFVLKHDLTPFGIWYPAITVSLVMHLPLPITTGYILKQEILFPFQVRLELESGFFCVCCSALEQIHLLIGWLRVDVSVRF